MRQGKKITDKNGKKWIAFYLPVPEDLNNLPRTGTPDKPGKGFRLAGLFKYIDTVIDGLTFKGYKVTSNIDVLLQPCNEGTPEYDEGIPAL